VPNNQTGFIKLIVIAVLLVGIGVAVYLTQFTQVFKPKAAETSLTKITEENYEPTLNPFGDPWAWKKSSNPNAPVVLSAPTHYLSYQDSSGTILERQAQYLAKSNAPFLYLDSYEPHIEGQNPKSIAFLTRVKQLNPNIKFLGYFVQWEAPPGYDEILQGANNGNSAFESFFVHKKGLPSTKENRLWARPDHPEWGFTPQMDITNPNYRTYIIPKVVETIRSAKMDGVMTDMLFYGATDAFNNPPNTMSDNYMPDNIKSAWPGAMVAYVQELKAAMGSDLYIFGNVNDDEPQFMQNDLLSPGRLDGVIFEDPFNGRPDPNALNKVISLMNIVDSLGKKSILIVSGAANGTTYSNTNADQEKLVQRYFFTAYLMTLRSANHMYLYFHPSSIFFQYHSEAFFKEWDLNIGNATSEAQNLGNGVYLRTFQQAYVYWNPTYNNYTIPSGRDLYNIDNSQEIAGQVVPANSGAIFVTSSLLAEYNRPPESAISPSPSAPIGTFTLTPPETFCSGTNSHIKLSWTALPNGPQPGTNSGYLVYVDGAYQYNQLQNLELTDPTARNYGQTYKYKIEAVTPAGRVFSNEQSVVARDCTAPPSPSPIVSPSSSPIKKIGDIDKNGKVDIFDFNIFVGDYPAKNLRSDVNQDGQVNIFDFNLLITYFGK
jgi:hypothetical protein